MFQFSSWSESGDCVSLTTCCTVLDVSTESRLLLHALLTGPASPRALKPVGRAARLAVSADTRFQLGHTLGWCACMAAKRNRQ